MSRCLEVSPKVLALRNPKRENPAEFHRRASDLHNELCPPQIIAEKVTPPEAELPDMMDMGNGITLPRRIVEAALEVSLYMNAEFSGLWKLCGLQKRID